MQSKIDSLVAEYRRKLLAPDFNGFEAHYGCPVPPELRKFYDLREGLLAGVLYATATYAPNDGPIRFGLIQNAVPMDRVNWTERYGREFFRFATSTDGYALLIKPVLSRSPVFADWDDGKPTMDIEELDFTLWDIVDTLGSNP